MKPKRMTMVVCLVGVQLLGLLVMRGGSGDLKGGCTRVGEAGQPRESPEPGSGKVPASFFGMHIQKASPSRWPRAPIVSWRLWDSHTAWPFLEPTKGQWDWDLLDRLVELARDRGVEILLPLGMSPAWASARPTEPSAYGRPGFAAEPADITDWRHFVESVVARYSGRIRLFEIWNEPNVTGFYTGSVEKMVRLCREAYAIIKRDDPDNVVVSPAAATVNGVPWLDAFLSAGGADCFDVVGFHFYVEPGPPEAIPAAVDKVKRVLVAHGIDDRPLWNTESGWFVTSKRPAASAEVRAKRVTLSERDGAAYLVRALLLARASGIARFYWYAWDDADMGLVEHDGSSKPAVRAFTEIQRWLVGSELLGCKGSPDGTWVCPIVRQSKPAWIVWNPAGRRSFPVPRPWRATAWRDLLGKRRRLETRSISIGPQPALVEGSRR